MIDKPVELHASRICANWYPITPASTPKGVREALKIAGDDFVKKVREIRQSIRSNKTIEPILVTKSGDCYRIKDGNARFFAWILEGNETINVIIEDA